MLGHVENVMIIDGEIDEKHVYTVSTCFGSTKISLHLVKLFLVECLVYTLIQYWRSIFFIEI